MVTVCLFAAAAGCDDPVDSSGQGGPDAPGIQLPDVRGQTGDGGAAVADTAAVDAPTTDDGGTPDEGGQDVSNPSDASDESDAPDAGQAVDAGQTDGGGDTGTPDAGTPDAGPDLDLDGLPDSYEAQVAADYLPIIAVHAEDGCPLGGIVFRARPHPENPALIHVIYDHLFEKDCGLTGHVGDNEVFSATINPAKPPAEGVTYLKAISHQATICQKITECGACNNAAACETGDDSGMTRPLVYSSKDKHGTYVLVNDCNLWTCFDQCAAAPRTVVPLTNAGEPDAHLTEDLTAGGFITQANGWTEPSVFNFNPWEAGKEFGTAGVVADDLVDPAFDTPPCE
ncbi:MAG: hypothetical protein HY897_04565 [Deltaproteobacteria bacterium]|nr:hypothetical protein [Deltaproteobacteria bacterium]